MSVVMAVMVVGMAMIVHDDRGDDAHDDRGGDGAGAPDGHDRHGAHDGMDEADQY